MVEESSYKKTMSNNQEASDEATKIPQPRMQWMPISKSFKDKVKEKVGPKKREKSTQDTNRVWTL